LSDRGFVWWLVLFTGTCFAALLLFLVGYLTTPTIACLLFIVTSAATAAIRYRRGLLSLYLMRRERRAAIKAAEKADLVARQVELAKTNAQVGVAPEATEDPGKGIPRPVPELTPVDARPEKQCPLCMMIIDRKAVICPHCRSRQPMPTPSRLAYIVLAGGLVSLPLLVCRYVSDRITDSLDRTRGSGSYRSDGSYHGGGDASAAWVAAQDFVKEKLAAPSTADFGWQTSGDCAKSLGGGRYSVRAWVDAENRFGAKVRTQFSCQLVDLGDGDWRCESLVLE
jgi:hypothetical protein